MALAVGTGIAYLSAEPCPIKAWIGVGAHGNNPLKSGVADSGGPSLIEESLVPPKFTITESPLNPTFHGVGCSTTGVKGYVSLPIRFPNAAFQDSNYRRRSFQ